MLLRFRYVIKGQSFSFVDGVLLLIISTIILIKILIMCEIIIGFDAEKDENSNYVFINNDSRNVYLVLLYN
jgi:hypothetical protein